MENTLKEKLRNLIYYAVISYLFLKNFYVMIWAVAKKNVPYSFRDDNFFSFTSGHIRRGLSGEIIYRINTLGINGILVYSGLMMVLFSILYGIIFKKLIEKLSITEKILIPFSPFIFNMGTVLGNGVDREIFIVLPLVYYYFRKKTDSIFYILIAIVLFINEITLFLYAPFIIVLCRQIFKKPAAGTIISAITIFIGVAALLFLNEDITNILETYYWPTYGVNNLTDSFLYSFGGMPISALFTKHFNYLTHIQTIYALPGLILFYLFSIYILNKKAMMPYTTWFYVTVNFLIFILTIDYGRYYYILFAFYLIIGQTHLIEIIEENLEKIFYKVIAFIIHANLLNVILRFSVKHSTIILFLFILAPIGYWVFETQFMPAFILELDTLFKKIS